MSNGWDWVQEGQRIAEESRRAGEVDIDAIKASSIVFNNQEVFAEAPKPPAGYYQCLTRRCESLYYENEVGGEARGIVGQIAKAVGVDLSPPLDGNVWSPRNMARVLTAVHGLVDENKKLNQEAASRDHKETITVKALHEALTHLGEAV